MRSLLLLLLIFPLTAFGQNARKVNVESGSLFPFDPLSGRYVSGSLSQLVEYVKQWKQIDSLDLTISYKPLLGYDIYEKIADSTLSERVLRYFMPFNRVDSISRTLNISQLPHSKEYASLFNDDINKIKRFYSTPIATMQDSIFIRNTYFGPSEFASYFHQFQLDISNAQISLFAPPAPDGFLQKEIYIKDITDLFKFDNQLVTFKLSGYQIKKFLEEIYNRRYYKLRDENSDLVRFNTPYYQHISAAGVSYKYNLTKGKIEDFSLDLNSIYTVVSNSFLANKFTDKTEIGNYRIELLKWLRSSKNITPKIIETWSLSPERWTKVIVQRELNNQLLHK